MIKVHCFVLLGILVLGGGELCECFYENEENVGFLGRLHGYVGEIGNVMNEVASGVQKLSRGIRTVEEFLDATIDEDCYFECPLGKIAVKNKRYVPSSNGCGSFGLEDYLKEDILPLSELTECCNDHDLCYGHCGSDKDECDLKFKKCLYKKCSKHKDSMSKLHHKGCQAGAKILYTGTTTLGCKAFMNAQEESCLCLEQKGKDEL